jgi:hypothetical protein
VTHCTDDDLTMYYYGEGRGRAAIERHLANCPRCTALYREITATLEMIQAPEPPARGGQYGLEVWQRIRHRLPEQNDPGFLGLGRFAWFGFSGFATAGAIAVLVVAAFVAGRSWRQPAATSTTARVSNPSSSSGPSKSSSSTSVDTSDRILVASVADHLDRSERVLTDIMNLPARSNISLEQHWAEDLLQTSRLYRQDAVDAGEQSVAAVLDDLERNLLEIVHSPSTISAADLEQLRRRIDAAALLFKVRVMSDELRQREQPPAVSAAPRTSTRKVS